MTLLTYKIKPTVPLHICASACDYQMYEENFAFVCMYPLEMCLTFSEPSFAFACFTGKLCPGRPLDKPFTFTVAIYMEMLFSPRLFIR